MPTYADLYAWWMSVDGDLAPTPLRDDSFTLRRVTVSSSGARYLRIAAGENAAINRFVLQMSLWTAATERSNIESACADFVTVLRNYISALGRARWPTQARGLVHTLTGKRVCFSVTQDRQYRCLRLEFPRGDPPGFATKQP
jgi:hypothetical protein